MTYKGCEICRKKVSKGEGTFYAHHLVHKKVCLAKAKILRLQLISKKWKQRVEKK